MMHQQRRAAIAVIDAMIGALLLSILVAGVCASAITAPAPGGGPPSPGAAQVHR
jgi:hypothetical protein